MSRRSALPADERARRSGQVRVGHGLQRREALRSELEQRDGVFVEVLQPVLAEVEQLGRAAELPARVVREHDLAAVAGTADPCREMNVDADVALAGQDRRAGVNADPHAHRPRLEQFSRIPRRPPLAPRLPTGRT